MIPLKKLQKIKDCLNIENDFSSLYKTLDKILLEAIKSNISAIRIVVTVEDHPEHLSDLQISKNVLSTVKNVLIIQDAKDILKPVYYSSYVEYLESFMDDLENIGYNVEIIDGLLETFDEDGYVKLRISGWI